MVGFDSLGDSKSAKTVRRLQNCERKIQGCTLQETNISPQNGILKMIFLFPRWDMLISWRVVHVVASFLMDKI